MSKLVKVRLIKDGTVLGRGSKVAFPCDVMAPVEKATGGDWLLAKPTTEELSRVGFDMRGFPAGFARFYVGTECEIIND